MLSRPPIEQIEQRAEQMLDGLISQVEYEAVLALCAYVKELERRGQHDTVHCPFCDSGLTLSEKEVSVIVELSMRQQISPEKVWHQALAVYQMHLMGAPDLGTLADSPSPSTLQSERRKVHANQVHDTDGTAYWLDREYVWHLDHRNRRTEVAKLQDGLYWAVGELTWLPERRKGERRLRITQVSLSNRSASQMRHFGSDRRQPAPPAMQSLSNEERKGLEAIAATYSDKPPVFDQAECDAVVAANLQEPILPKVIPATPSEPAPPRTLPGHCAECGISANVTYVKTAAGFKKVCLTCADLMKAAGKLIEPDRVMAAAPPAPPVAVMHDSQVCPDCGKAWYACGCNADPSVQNSAAAPPSSQREGGPTDCCGERPHKADCPECLLQMQQFIWIGTDDSWFKRNRERIWDVMRKHASHVSASERGEHVQQICQMSDDIASIVSTHRSDWTWSDVVSDVAALRAEVERLKREWAIMARAVGNWRDFGGPPNPETDQTERDWAHAAWCIVECERLKGELKNEQSSHQNTANECAELTKWAETAKAERDQTRQALRIHGMHDSSCPSSNALDGQAWKAGDESTCTCGLKKALGFGTNQ